MFAFILHKERNNIKKPFLSFLASSETFISIHPLLVRFHFAMLSIFYSFYHFGKCREVCFSLPISRIRSPLFMAHMKQYVMRDVKRFVSFHLNGQIQIDM